MAERRPDPPTSALRRAPVPALPRVHQIVLPTSNEVGPVQVYAIEGEPFTLIDTGLETPESWAALSAALDALGVGPDEVERVIVTHCHRDHIGQVQALRDAGARLELCAHEADAPMIECFTVERDERIDSTYRLFREHGVPDDLLEQIVARRRAALASESPLCRATSVDRILRGGERLAFKDFELEVIHSPGHTAGHILLHERQSGVVFCGDHVMGSAVAHTETYALEDAVDPSDPLGRRPRFHGLFEYLRSLRAVRSAHYATFLPGQGGIIRRPERAIEDALLYYDVRVQRIERGLRNVGAMGAWVSAYELWHALFPQADPLTQMRTSLLMIIGALDVLERAGACRVERRADGVLVHADPRAT